MRHGDGDICQHCERNRGAHGYGARARDEKAGETPACERFYLKPQTFEYRPPEGDRGADPAVIETQVTCYVENLSGETSEIHTFHEAELRHIGTDGITGLERMWLQMPDRCSETDEFRDVDGDRSYRRRAIYYAPGQLHVQGGAWVNVTGLCFYNPKNLQADAPYEAEGPNGSFLMRRERWYQSVPRESLAEDTADEDVEPIVVYE